MPRFHFSNATVELDAGIDGNLGPVEQPDVSAEEWDELRRLLTCTTQAEIVLIRSFEKESAFLREEQRKTREIDLPGINFGLCKIGVGREDSHQLRSNLPGDFTADCSLPCS